MADLKYLKRILDENGNSMVVGGDLIVDKTTGVSFSQHHATSDIHTPKATIDAERAAAITTAVNLLKDGADGSTLPTDSASLKKLSDALGLLKGTVETFLSGEPDAGTVDRLSELVASINANKDTIDDLLTGKVSVSDIVDNLASTDVAKALSANQGHALKAMIDALETQVNETFAALHTHANKAVVDGLSASATSGNLVFNGKELGNTGLSFVANTEDTPVFTGKMVFVVESYTRPAD